MFIGHFGLGFAAKKINNRPSLGSCFLAAQFIDLLWPFFLVVGIEKVAIEPGNTEFTPLNFISYPYSHSLVAVLVWAVLFALVYYFFKKDRNAAILLGSLVISHWLLDLLTHRPDLPLTPWLDIKVGLGLWENKMATLLLELSIFAIGCYLYLTTTAARNKVGAYAAWGLMLFLLLVYFLNAYGPPPQSADNIGVVGFSQWILIIWAYWVDRNRVLAVNHEKSFFHHQIE